MIVDCVSSMLRAFHELAQCLRKMMPHDGFLDWAVAFKSAKKPKTASSFFLFSCASYWGRETMENLKPKHSALLAQRKTPALHGSTIIYNFLI